MKRERIPLWRLLVLSVATNGVFLLVTLDAAGRWFLPLDDAFIYFQYARRIAEGRPFSYQPGGGFSTGATSPLYPFLLAPFARVMGPLALTWLVLGLSVVWKWLAAAGSFAALRSLTRHRAPAWIAAALVIISGSFTYGSMTGMETGMLSAAATWSLAMWVSPLARRRPASFSALLAVLSLSRPEAALVPLILALAAWFGSARLRPLRWPLLASLVPGLAYLCLVYAMTGAAELATAKAKLLGSHPFQTWTELATRVGYWLDRIGRLRVAEELALPPLVLLLVAIGAVGACRGGRWTVLAWAVPLTAPFCSVVPLLHDGRYFAGWIPIVLCGWALGAWTMVSWLPRRHRAAGSWIASGVALAATIASLPAKAQEFSHLANEMARMHLRAADWMRRELPREAVVGIHDAGILTGLGGRSTIDFNGLVTPEFAGAAASGPGSIYEAMAKLPFARFPTHIASFPAFTSPEFQGPRKARFPVEDNVWAAGTALVVWDANLPWVTRADKPASPMDGWHVVDSLNHADLASERDHDYWCREANAWKMYEPARLRHLAEWEDSAIRITEGGRFCSEEERFSLRAQPGRRARLVLRMYSAERASLSVVAGDETTSASLDKSPESFQEISVDIPAEAIKSSRLPVALSPHRGTMPVADGLETYRAWLLQEGEEPEAPVPLFEKDLLQWYEGRFRGYLPLDQRFEVFWHTGWSDQVVDGEPLKYRWVAGTKAALAFPVRHIGPAPFLILDGTAQGAEEAIPNTLTATINGATLPPVAISGPIKQRLRIALPPGVVRPGLNALTLEFEHGPSPRDADPASTDDRELPFAVYAVEIHGCGWAIDSPESTERDKSP